MGKRLEQTIQTRENLKTAFWDIYEQKPLDQITVREVTDLAGYNRGTFYVYFKDVYDVLEQTEQEIMEIFEKDENFGFDPQDREHFCETIRFYIGFIENHYRYLMLLAGERGDPKFMRKLQTLVEQKASKLMRPYSNLDESRFYYAVSALITAEASTLMRWFLRGKDLPFDELTDLLYDLLFEGPLDLLTQGTRWEKWYL
ncbi:TetR/AcrR family transcriptional regulator [Yanshouia hominis]|uniref:TetR/AcrR family transcriptional regulator n=1 Tax=Yanshouia hominis TaxID=2763673 RepID=A0ABR7NLT6_9FIRM|nr:TetR/AcrR family transcriptional regulator [Yanshouia hominis]MBC8577373.1 TetR/AcrR family transcriptional regulator [Yanshouia hominis]